MRDEVGLGPVEIDQAELRCFNRGQLRLRIFRDDKTQQRRGEDAGDQSETEPHGTGHRKVGREYRRTPKLPTPQAAPMPASEVGSRELVSRARFTSTARPLPGPRRAC